MVILSKDDDGHFEMSWPTQEAMELGHEFIDFLDRREGREPLRLIRSVDDCRCKEDKP
jgi:hypothetical protein